METRPPLLEAAPLPETKGSLTKARVAAAGSAQAGISRISLAHEQSQSPGCLGRRSPSFALQ